MNLDYTKVTHEQLLEQFRNRIITDPKFKNMSAAAIFQIYMEMMTGTFDMLHFYLGRTAEEMFFDSAKLDSSIIKLAKNLGYNPKRAIPATAEIAIKLSGPLPKNTAAGDVIWFNNEQLKLKFNNKPYRLDHCYSYTITADDVANGINNANWSKTIMFSIPANATNGWIPLTTKTDYLDKIRIIQCEVKVKEIYAVSNAEHLTESYQFYDIDDIKFSNYYGIRDPFAYHENEYIPENGWCKIGIGVNQADAFSKEKLCDIEVENIYCNPKAKALNTDIGQTKKLNICKVESNSDKTVRISFGDGTLVNNGFNNDDEILYVQYVSTDGYAANTPDVINSTLTNSSRIMAHAPGKVYDITDNIAFILTTNISNGEDFESAIRIKNSAAVHFASRGQLVNKKDFNDYFNSISKPIQAKNAVAWTAQELRATTNNYNVIEANCKKANDIVFYTVIGDLYKSLGNNKYTIKNVYSNADESIFGSTTLYNSSDDFNSHIADLAKCVKDQSSLQEIITKQLLSNDDPFSLNTNTIYHDIEEKLSFGVIPISVPPIVQYYDLVGTVELDRTANVTTYQEEVESTLYKWLAARQKFNNTIYKSDLIKLIYANAATKSVNVDITPSSIIADNADYYGFNLSGSSNQAELAQIISTLGFKDNIIIIPRTSTYAKINSTANNNTQKIVMSEAAILAAKTIGLCKAASADAMPSDSTQFTTVSVKSVTELSDGRIQITLADASYNIAKMSTNASDKLWLKFAKEVSFNADDQSSANNSIINAAKTGITTKTAATGTNETAVPLPYIAKVDDAAKERELTYRRTKDKYDATVISEKSLNFKFAPDASSIVDEYVPAYKKLKFAIEDTVLDDNNNIVNFTLPNEIAIVRIKLNYTYGRK